MWGQVAAGVLQAGHGVQDAPSAARRGLGLPAVRDPYAGFDPPGLLDSHAMTGDSRANRARVAAQLRRGRLVAGAVTGAAPDWSFGVAAIARTLDAGMPRIRRPLGLYPQGKVQAAGSPGISRWHSLLPSGDLAPRFFC